MTTQLPVRDCNLSPFDIPFEHPSGVPLDFNFWTRRTFLETEKDVVDLMTSLLSGTELDSIKRSDKNKNPVKIILAIAQGVDSTIMTPTSIRSSSFFSQCSSLPIKQPNSRNSRVSPTETVYSTLLWPQKPSAPFDDMKYFQSKQLFEDFTLKFQATHTDWQDVIVFNCNKVTTTTNGSTASTASTASASFYNLIAQKKEQMQTAQQTVAVMSTLAERTEAESDVFGYFRRTKVPDSGLYMYRSSSDDDSGTLILAWFKSGVRRLDLIPSQGFDSRDRSNSNSSYTQHELDSIRRDEEEAFEWLEQQKKEEKEEENDIGNDENNSDTIKKDTKIKERTKKNCVGEDEIKKKGDDNDNEKNNDNVVENVSSKPVMRRNAALEFSLFLDENSTVDLYLELVSGVKKEIFEEDVVDGGSGSGSGSGSGNTATDNNGNNGNNNHNHHNHNGNNGNNWNNNSSSSSSSAKNYAERSTTNTIKKTKFDSIDSTSYTNNENTPKKRKTNDHVSTHILYHTDEEITDLHKSKNSLLQNIYTPLSPKNLSEGVAEKSNSVKNNKDENSFCYNPKYFDNETHVRFSAMYVRCEGVPLDSLVLSEGMLMLMGYPGCDGEEAVDFTDTSGPSWALPPVVKYHQEKRKIIVEVEEGEEGEEGEEIEGGQEEGNNMNNIRNNNSNNNNNNNWNNNGNNGDDNCDNFLAICGVDCEMCYTEKGLELTRVTLVCPQRGVVFDSLVKPCLPVIDYNTAYSGITKELLDNVTTTIKDVHASLRKIISPQTILVGHSLDCDLRALALIHRRIVDTAALYPHPKGSPYKQALKKLAMDYLGRVVQADSGSLGHDSIQAADGIQDAAIALELALLKAQPGNTTLGLPVTWGTTDVPRYPLFAHISDHIAAHPPKYQLVPPSSISVHGCGMMSVCPSWERFSFAVPSEADPCVAFNHFERTSKNFRKTYNFCKYVRSSEAIHGAIAEMRECNAKNKEKGDIYSDIFHQPNFMWIDMNLSENSEEKAVIMDEIEGNEGENNDIGDMDDNSDQNYDNDNNNNNNNHDRNNHNNHEDKLSPFSRADKALEDLYNLCEARTYVLVLSQADLGPVVQLMAKKQRFRWEVQAAKQSNNPGAQRNTVAWTEWEERELEKEMDILRSGAMFIRQKI